MYNVILLNNCKKYLDRLQTQEYLKISRSILRLKTNPRPTGLVKLSNSEYWRIRESDYRIVFLIDDSEKTVTVTKIGHRREIYREL